MKSDKIRSALEIVIIESIPLARGIAFSSLGRIVSHPEFALVPPLSDVIGGIYPQEFKDILRLFWMYTKYSIGVAIPYIDRFPETYRSIEGVI